MITKLLFTLAVIGVALFMLQLRRRPVPVPATPQGKKELFIRKWFRLLSVVVISLMILAAGVYIYVEWQQAREVLRVQVIDNRTGNSKEYRVIRGNLQDRSFQTMDGRIVKLADTDRMEIVTTQ